jgi:hypothetical protein
MVATQAEFRLWIMIIWASFLVSYHTFSKVIKGSSKQNVVGGIANNMYLHIEGNVANVAGYVSH